MESLGEDGWLQCGSVDREGGWRNICVYNIAQVGSEEIYFLISDSFGGENVLQERAPIMIGEVAMMLCKQL